MARKLVASALCFALLSACAPIDGSIGDLLHPPRINVRQTQVEQALGAHISPGSIQHQSPQEGAYRSPFVFSDMNGDGLKEAIVFYTPVGGGGIRFKFLREEAGGQWRLIDDRAGFGDRVHIVRFANLLSSDSQNLLIGWENTGTGERRLDVFSYQGGRLSSVYQATYTAFDIDRYSAGELEQIALVRQDAAGEYQLHLLGRTLDGRLSLMGEAALSWNTHEVLSLTKGTLRDQVFGIYVDARRFDFQIATEIFEIATGALIPLVADHEDDAMHELYRQTFRSDSALLSVDLRGDGRVRIPVHHEQELPGLFTETELEPPPLTLYLRYDHAGRLEIADVAVINHSAGYLFFFPERWVGNVTVLRRPEIHEWRFYEVNPLTNLRSAELLRIQVYSIHDYRDPLTDNYIHLTDRGIFQFFGYIPNTASELAISPQEMERNFMLL